MLPKFRIILTILLFALLLLCNSIKGQTIAVGSRSASLGYCSVALKDFWGIINNPASISNIAEPSTGIYYDFRYMNTDLSIKSIAVVIPTKFGVLGSSYFHMGYSLYNRQKIGLAYGRSFGNYLRVGLQLDYVVTSLGNGYGNNGKLTFDIGIQSDISKKITLGAWVINPINVKVADFDDETLPTTYKFGFLWAVSSNLQTTCEVEKNSIIAAPIFRVGVEYGIKERYYTRIGTTTGNEILTFGGGIIIGGFNLDLSAIMHNTLGFSEQISLIYNFR